MLEVRKGTLSVHKLARQRVYSSTCFVHRFKSMLNADLYKIKIDIAAKCIVDSFPVIDRQFWRIIIVERVLPFLSGISARVCNDAGNAKVSA